MPNILILLVASFSSFTIWAVDSVPGLAAGKFALEETDALHLVYPLSASAPAELDRFQESHLRSGLPLPSYRFESHGDAALSLYLSGPSDSHPVIIVEGPLSGEGDRVPVGTGPLFRRSEKSADGKATLEVTLKEKGIYRVIVGPRESLLDGKPIPADAVLSLESACRAKCFRPSVSPSQLLQSLGEKEREKVFARMEQEIQISLVDPDLAKETLARFRALRADPKKWSELDHGIVLPPMTKWGEFQKALGQVGSKPVPLPPKIQADLTAFLDEQTFDRKDAPPPLLKEPVELRYGHFDNQGLPEKQVKHSTGLARLLNALAVDNKSVVHLTDPKTKQAIDAHTPSELFQALLKTGHQIELKQERVFANFLSFGVDGKDLRWPVWTDTGLKLADGKRFLVPAGHTQYTWKVKGPLVDGEVAFFQGVSGTGFFPKLDQRPEWTGSVIKQKITSGEGKDDLITKAAEVAARYQRRILLEAETTAKGAPAQGYAKTGVCNNSTSTIQSSITSDDKLPLAYPILRDPKLLARPAQFKDDPRFNDHLDEVFRDLPADGAVDEASLKDPKARARLFCRILEMNPLPLSSPIFAEEPFSTLRESYELAAKETKGECGPPAPPRPRAPAATHG